MRGISFIRTWLDGRQDYAQGVALAEEHGTTAQLLVLLNQGENPFTRRKLRTELQRLADTKQVAMTAPGRAAAAPAAASPVTAARAAEPPAAAPAGHVGTPPVGAQETPAQSAALAPLRATRLEGFKRASWLKSRLELMASDELRYEAACEIKQLWRENQKSWDDEGYYLEFGFFPPEAQPVPGLDRSNPAQVLKRRNTLRTYVTHQRGTPEKQAAWQAELLELTRILDDE